MNTVVLDLDGPLLDGRLRHYACYCEILAAQGFPVLPVDDYWAMKRARRNRRELLAATGAGVLDAVFLSGWLERIEQPDLLKLDRLQPGVLSVLDEWIARGARLILATMRRDADRLAAQLRESGLAQRFSSVLCCDRARGGVGKAQRVLQSFPHLDPRRCIWIGDTEADVSAAREIGCEIWAVASGLRDEAYLRSLNPDYLSADLCGVDLALVWPTCDD